MNKTRLKKAHIKVCNQWSVLKANCALNTSQAYHKIYFEKTEIILKYWDPKLLLVKVRS